MNEPGIVVFGHRRPVLLRQVLESLRRQGVLDRTHVWVDGIAHAREILPQVEAVRALKQEFPTAGWVDCHGRLGIEKLMLDALTDMARRYRDIVVLEDDCFPTADAIEVFSRVLDEVRDDAGIYSVYGNPFGFEGDAQVFPRFQGWGWATTRDKLVPVLAQLKSMFMMAEPEYLAWVGKVLTPELRARLDITGRRNVVNVFTRQFSWDSATALLTALLGMQHRLTPRRVVYNCGAGADSGHFRLDVDQYRAPPYNMVGVDEVWQFFHAPLPKRYQGRQWFGLDELDRKLSAFITAPTGTFVELGAFDGLNQSNTLWLERRGWRGVLIEAVADYAESCRRHRPFSQVFHAACVAPEQAGGEVEVHQVGLMSLVDGARSADDQARWIQRGEELQKLTRSLCRAPARTLSSILDQAGVTKVDLLSLDVEGFERQVLAGLDLRRHLPALLLVEDSRNGDLQSHVTALGFELVQVLQERPYTVDLLFRPGPSLTPPAAA